MPGKSHLLAATKSLKRADLSASLLRSTCHALLSQANGGNWGQSDEVVVKARNQVVTEETEKALAQGCRKIMIMYGGLHMQVLQPGASQLVIHSN